MFLFPPTALFNSVITETNLPLLLLRSTKCDDENREAHAASPPKGNEKQEREETKEISTLQQHKDQNLKARRQKNAEKRIVREKNKNRRRITNALEIEEEIHPQAPERNSNSRSNQGTQQQCRKKHEESERERGRDSEKTSDARLLHLNGPWPWTMAHGPRAPDLTQPATYESVYLYIRSYTIYNVSHMFSIILSYGGVLEVSAHKMRLGGRLISMSNERASTYFWKALEQVLASRTPPLQGHYQVVKLT
jgi:hypothetical protein